MSDRPYLQHGSRHAILGSDPIPYFDYAELDWSGSHSVAGSGGTYTIPWTGFGTSNDSVFGTVLGSSATPHNVTGDTGLLLRAPGVYIASGTTEWEGGALKTVAAVRAARGQALSSTIANMIEYVANNVPSSGVSVVNASWMMVAVAEGATGLLNLDLENHDSSAWHVTSALMGCVYIPVSNEFAFLY